MTLVNVASTADLKPNEKKAVEVNGVKVLLVNLNGIFYAIGDKCTHRGCSLSKGTIMGDNLQCACHGSTFNLKTGSCEGPRQGS
jgi:nitrite reductase/ring-hydroxylating ferredoxin subunit